MKKKEIVIIGGGGHAKVLIDAILSSDAYRITGILDPALKKGAKVSGYDVLGGDGLLFALKGKYLALGVGTVRASGRRKAIYTANKKKGFEFPPIVHAKAYVAVTAKLGKGSQVLAGAVVNPGAAIGEDTIINTKAIIEHDCAVGPHSHIASGAILGGDVKVGAGSHVGMGARILQGVKIGRGVTVGAGAVVLKDVPDGKTVAGIPARII